MAVKIISIVKGTEKSIICCFYTVIIRLLLPPSGIALYAASSKANGYNTTTVITSFHSDRAWIFYADQPCSTYVANNTRVIEFHIS